MAGKPGNLLPQALVLSKFQRQHAGGQGRAFGKALWRKAIDFDVMRAIRLRSGTFDPFVLSKGFQEEIHLSNADVQPFGYLALGQARVDLQQVHDIEGEAIVPSLAWLMIVGLGQGDEGLVLVRIEIRFERARERANLVQAFYKMRLKTKRSRHGYRTPGDAPNGSSAWEIPMPVLKFQTCSRNCLRI